MRRASLLRGICSSTTTCGKAAPAGRVATEAGRRPPVALHVLRTCQRLPPLLLHKKLQLCLIIGLPRQDGEDRSDETRIMPSGRPENSMRREIHSDLLS